MRATVNFNNEFCCRRQEICNEFTDSRLPFEVNPVLPAATAALRRYVGPEFCGR